MTVSIRTATRRVANARRARDSDERGVFEPAGGCPSEEVASVTGEELAARVRDARPETVSRTVLAVTALHGPDRRGRYSWCRAEYRGWRWWRRSTHPCPTLRVITSTLVAAETQDSEPRWVSA